MYVLPKLSVNETVSELPPVYSFRPIKIVSAPLQFVGALVGTVALPFQPQVCCAIGDADQAIYPAFAAPIAGAKVDAISVAVCNEAEKDGLAASSAAAAVA